MSLPNQSSASEAEIRQAISDIWVLMREGRLDAFLDAQDQHETQREYYVNGQWQGREMLAHQVAVTALRLLGVPLEQGERMARGVIFGHGDNRICRELRDWATRCVAHRVDVRWDTEPDEPDEDQPNTPRVSTSRVPASVLRSHSTGGAI